MTLSGNQYFKIPTYYTINTMYYRDINQMSGQIDYINGVPQKYQWYGDTPSYFSFCNNGQYGANDTISTNHLSEEGNKICSDILYKKLKGLGWDEE